jgi:HEAT repeats
MKTTMKLVLREKAAKLGLLVALTGSTTLAGAPKVAEAAPPGTQGAAFRMPAQPFADLRRDVVQARAADPRPFAMVNDIVTFAPEVNAHARARRAPIALYLAKLGPSAVLPVLEKLAIDAPRGLTTQSAPILRRDLIEAVGLLHDPRGLPVLSAIIDDETEDEETTRTATEAIARIGTDEAASKLVASLAGARDARARAIVAGMGECRRLLVTEAAAERLRVTTDDATARVAARALGRAGNAWAWRTMADRSEEARIRETAARALVEAFARRNGEERTAAANALLVVDAPETPALIAAAKKGAIPDTVKALEGLAARFARNPTRTR